MADARARHTDRSDEIIDHQRKLVAIRRCMRSKCSSLRTLTTATPSDVRHPQAAGGGRLHDRVPRTGVGTLQPQRRARHREGARRWPRPPVRSAGSSGTADRIVLEGVDCEPGRSTGEAVRIHLTKRSSDRSQTVSLPGPSGPSPTAGSVGRPGAAKRPRTRAPRHLQRIRSAIALRLRCRSLDNSLDTLPRGPTRSTRFPWSAACGGSRGTTSSGTQPEGRLVCRRRREN